LFFTALLFVLHLYLFFCTAALCQPEGAVKNKKQNKKETIQPPNRPHRANKFIRRAGVGGVNQKIEGL
jgi:hypothetical protein